MGTATSPRPRDVDVLVADSPAVRRQVTEALATLEATRLDGTVLTAGLAMPDQGWPVDTGLGRVDVLLEGPPPLDLASVEADAESGDRRHRGADQRAGAPCRLQGASPIA